MHSEKIKYRIMDTQEVQNCWEPIIHEKEKVINAFVNDELQRLMDVLEETSVGVSYEYMIGKEQEEYAKTVKCLSDIYNKCPPMKHIKDALDKPDFIWDSLFIEDIGKDDVSKWYRNPLNADIKMFRKENTIYDEENPYLSYIYKVLLFERYKRFLREDLKKRKMLLVFDKDLSRWEQNRSQDRKNIQVPKGKSIITPAAMPSTTPPDMPAALPTFEHTLTDRQMSHLTSIINELHIFREENITTEQLKSIFACSPVVTLHSKNNRLLAHLFDQLSRRDYITENWQVVIAKNRLFKSSQKDNFLNQNDLSTATNKLLTMEKSDKYTKLEVYIKNLKNH